MEGGAIPLSFRLVRTPKPVFDKHVIRTGVQEGFKRWSAREKDNTRGGVSFEESKALGS